MIKLHDIYRQLSRVASIVMIFGLAALLSNSIVTADDKNLVKVHVDGGTRLISTKSTTVKSILDKLEVKLEEQDLVEPAIETDINESVFNINVYRSRPVMVIDGGTEQVVYSASTSGVKIAENAGLTVYPQDKFELARVTDFLKEGFVGMRLEITRSTPYTLDLYGEKNEERTHASNVAEALKQKSIELAESDEVEPSLDSSVKEGMTIYIKSVSTETVTEEVDIDFTEKRINDSSKDASFKEIETPGVKGLATVTYKITFENDKEVSREELSEVVKKEPVEQVVRVGTKSVLSSTHIAGGTKEDWMKAAGIPESDWWAVDYIVSRESGWNPSAVNPSSGACGLAQQLPCGKWDSFGPWNDPVSALTAQYSYVNARYGGYGGAYNFWTINHWY